MTPNQATLFFAAAYVVVALILAFCHWKQNALDVARSISKKTCLKHIAIAVITIIIGIAAMTGIYILRLAPEKTFLAIGALQFLMAVIADTLFFASWAQRLTLYPRGKWLAAVLIIMYAIADLFMPSGIKYGVLIVGTLAALLLPSAWEDAD